MGLATLWFLARSSLVDRWLSRAIGLALDRWTHLDVKDYAQLLHLSGNYSVRKLKIESEDWLEGRTLAKLGLHAEGIHVLGIERSDGTHVGVQRGTTSIDTGDLLILYGRDEAMEQLDHRRKGREGEREHEDEVKRQQKEDEREVLREETRRS